MNRTERWKKIQPLFFISRPNVVVVEKNKAGRRPTLLATIEREKIPKNIGDMGGWIGARDGALLYHQVLERTFSTMIESKKKQKPFRFVLNQLYEMKGVIAKASAGAVIRYQCPITKKQIVCHSADDVQKHIDALLLLSKKTQHTSRKARIQKSRNKSLR